MADTESTMTDQQKLAILRAQNKKRAEAALKKEQAQMEALKKKTLEYENEMEENGDHDDDDDDEEESNDENDNQDKEEEEDDDDEEESNRASSSSSSSSSSSEDQSVVSTQSPSKASERRRVEAMKYKARLADAATPSPKSKPKPIARKPVPRARNIQQSQQQQQTGPLRKIGRWIGIGRQDQSVTNAQSPSAASSTTATNKAALDSNNESDRKAVRAGGTGRRRGANYYKDESDHATAAKLAATGLTVAGSTDNMPVISSSKPDPKAERQIKELSEIKAKEAADKKIKENNEKLKQEIANKKAKYIADKKAKDISDKKANREQKIEARKKEIENRKRDREARKLHKQLLKAQEKAKGFIQEPPNSATRSPAAMRAYALLAEEEDDDDSDEERRRIHGKFINNGVDVEEDEDDDEYDVGNSTGWQPTHGRVLRRWMSSKVEAKGFFVNDLLQDLRDGEVLHVLLLCLFEEEPRLPPLPPRPQAGVGSAPRVAAVKSSLKWLLDVFGDAAPLHGIPKESKCSPHPKRLKSNETDTSGYREYSDDDESTQNSFHNDDFNDEDEDDASLEKIARGVVQGDEVATLCTVWAMWQGWALLRYVPIHAEVTAHVGCSETRIENNNLQGGAIHEGLREWLLCYFSTLVRLGYNQLNKDGDEEEEEEILANCPGEHGLKSFFTTNTSWWCSNCSNNIKKNVELMGCRTCDFDLCIACFQELTKRSTNKAYHKQMNAAQRAAWALSSGSTALVGSVFSLADADASQFIQQATLALCGHDVLPAGQEKTKLSTALSESTLILGIPMILEAKEFSHEKVCLMFLAELANCSTNSQSHQTAQATSNHYLHTLAADCDPSISPPSPYDNYDDLEFDPRALLWRIHALEQQLSGVLRRERRQRKALGVTTDSCVEMEAAIARSRDKRTSLLRRMTELGEEVEVLESAQKAAALEVHVAKTMEKGYQQQLKGLSESNEAFIAKLKSLEKSLKEAQAVNKARELADEQASKDAANEKAQLEKEIPTGHLRLTVVVKAKKKSPPPSSSSPSKTESVSPTKKLNEAMMNEKPRRLLYTCDGSLPVSWLLSMVLRDCNERDDLIGLRRLRRDVSLPATLLELHPDLSQVCSDGDVLEAVLSESAEPSSSSSSSSVSGEVQKDNANKKKWDDRLKAKQLFDAASSGKGVSTVEAFRVQRVVLTNWINYKIAPRHVFVDNLFSDLGDGLILKHLLEVITGELLDQYVSSSPHYSYFYEPSAPPIKEEESSTPRRILGISLGSRAKLIPSSSADRSEFDFDDNSSVSSNSSLHQNKKQASLTRSEKLHNMDLLFAFMGEKGILSKQATANEKRVKRPTSMNSLAPLSSEASFDEDEDEVRAVDIVDGNPSCTLQLIYAITVFTSLKEWGVKIPPMPQALDTPPTQQTSATNAGVPLNCGRRLVNWTTLRSLLVDFVSPRIRFCQDIPKTPSSSNGSGGGGDIVDLGPSLIDGKVILALLHHASPKQCPYDPFPTEDDDEEEDEGEGSIGEGSSGTSGSGKGIDLNKSKTIRQNNHQSKSKNKSKNNLNEFDDLEEEFNKDQRKKKKDLTCEEVETVRRNAFIRANVIFGCPPLLSDGSGDDLRDRGVGSESAPIAFRFESIGMLYLSELCIRISRCSQEARDSSLVATLTAQLDASVKRERRASMALTRSDLARRAEAKNHEKQVPVQIVKAESSESVELLSNEKETLAKENARLSAALVRIKVEREDLNTQLIKAEFRASKAEQEIKNLSAKSKDTIDDSQLNNLNQKAIVLKEDQSAMKSELVSLRNGTMADFKLLGMKLKDLSATHVQEIEKWKNAYLVANIERRKAFNDLMEFRGNIRVLCRVRDPKSERQQLNDDGSIAASDETSFHSGECGVIIDEDTIRVTHGNTSESKKWVFPRVFPLDVSQKEVFEEVSPMIQSVLDGYHATIFAYGQTGTGKTHTMQGGKTPSLQGVQPRALAMLLKKCEEGEEKDVDSDDAKQNNNKKKTKKKVGGGRISRKLSISVMEIYLDKVRDLLDERHGTKDEVKLDVRQGSSGNFVPGLTEKEVNSQEEIDHWIEFAAKRRSQAATDCNLHSSRSHLVMQVSCVSYDRISKVTLHGKLHLIDLAGSERIRQSQVEGQQLKETLSINKSLSTLSEVIAARASKRSHTPYRNSTLTFLLQDALSGDSKMTFIVCVSAAAANADETFASLTFAARAVTVEQAKSGTKHITNSPGK